MGGTSASSAGGIRTNTAVAVCPNLYPQLFLPRRSPPTLPDNPPPPHPLLTLVWGGGQRSEMALPSSGRRMGFVLVVVVAVQGWVRTRAGRRGGLSSSGGGGGVSADKEPDVWQTEWLTHFQASHGSSCSIAYLDAWKLAERQAFCQQLPLNQNNAPWAGLTAH